MLHPLALGLMLPILVTDRPFLDAAKHIENWLSTTAIYKDGDLVWPAVPDEENSRISFELYHGTSGVVLFYTELYRATGDSAFLTKATAGTSAMIKSMGSPNQDCGLHTGLAGLWFTLQTVLTCVEGVAGDGTGSHDTSALRDGANDAIARLTSSSIKKGEGVEWSTSNDIISGTAGIGLALLSAYQCTQDDRHLETAKRAGNRLLDVALETEAGLRWRMMPDYERFMPNFSHGTAGIAYFLARLARESGDSRYLNAAKKGADHLLTQIQSSGLIPHHLPGGEDLFYLGWCHGPAGTGRLFYELWSQTQDDRYLIALQKGMDALIDSRIPDRLHPGYWNNVSQCCGSAGIASFALAMHKLDGSAQYLNLARSLSVDLIARGHRDEKGLRWSQAEHRTQPQFLQAQIGHAQGASGIGLWLLRLDAFDEQREFFSNLPDSPF